MKSVRPSSEAEMLLVFLQGEIDSPDYGLRIKNYLQRHKIDRSEVIDNGDIQNDQQNEIRKRILADARGYPNDCLFYNFPDDVIWSRAEVVTDELRQFKYGNFPDWRDLSGGTRLVSDGAARLNSNSAKRAKVHSIAYRIANGAQFKDLIAVQVDNDYVLMEGHSRATAYLVANYSGDIGLIFGVSAHMDQWRFAKRK